MRTLTALTALLLLLSCNSGLRTYYPLNFEKNNKTALVNMPNEPGKCYAKGIQSDKVEVYNDTLGVFTLEAEVPPHMLGEVEFRPASTKWVKKKADKNCQSSDPNDCLVWCLESIPAVYGTPTVSIDSAGVEPMKYVVIPGKAKLLEAGGHTIWVEVLCEKDMDVRLLQQVHSALATRGYAAGVYPNDRLASKDLKAALSKFQEDNGLVKGQLSVETVEALGVFY